MHQANILSGLLIHSIIPEEWTDRSIGMQHLYTTA